MKKRQTSARKPWLVRKDVMECLTCGCRFTRRVAVVSGGYCGKARLVISVGRQINGNPLGVCPGCGRSFPDFRMASSEMVEAGGLVTWEEVPERTV